MRYYGRGLAETCVSILENIPDRFLTKVLVLPRAHRPIAASVQVRQAYPVPLRWLADKAFSLLDGQFVRNLDRSFLNPYFHRQIRESKPDQTIAYFWPFPPLPLLQYARDRGLLTVREMVATFRGTAKRILDDAYDRVGLEPGHGISAESVEYERKELAMYDYIFAPSPMVEASLAEAGIPAERIIPCSFGWSPARFLGAPDERDNNSFTALFVGRVEVGKGIPQLLAAWKKSGVQGELVLAGTVEDALKPLLKSYADTIQIRLLGFVSDLGRLYRSADIFVFPTLTEGDPLVTHEAAGCGLPIITTPMGAGRSVKNGVNGIVLDAYDVDGLAEAISQLATSEELRRKLGRQAGIDAQQYTYERVGLDRGMKLKGLLETRKD